MDIKWYRAAIALVGVVCFVNPVVTDSKPSTKIECLSVGVKGMPVNLTCEAMNNKKYALIWFRPDKKQVQYCDYATYRCGSTDKYKGKYAATFTSLKKNTLVITSFDPAVDSGAWECRDVIGSRGSFCQQKGSHDDDPSQPGKNDACVHVASTSCIMWMIAM